MLIRPLILGALMLVSPGQNGPKGLVNVIVVDASTNKPVATFDTLAMMVDEKGRVFYFDPMSGAPMQVKPGFKLVITGKGFDRLRAAKDGGAQWP